MDEGYRLDMLVDDEVIVEITTVDRILAAHEARPLSYLELLKHASGWLLNFKVPCLTQALRRKVNNF